MSYKIGGPLGMKFAVLGAGLQGSACAFDLLGRKGVEQVTLMDRETSPPSPFLVERAASAGARLQRLALDFEDLAAVKRALTDHDVALSAAPYYLNYNLAREAVAAGTHFADLGGNTEIVFKQLELDEQARAKGLSVIPDVGLAPGLVNILAAYGIRQLDQAEEVRIYVGGLPQNPEPPLNYAVVYSLEGALDYYTTPSWVLRDGQRVQVDALDEVELLDFPSLGKQLEGFHTGGGSSTLPWKYEGQVQLMEYKTLRYPGHAKIMRAIRDLGLLETEPAQVNGYTVVPRDVFVSIVAPKLTKPETQDLVAMRVIVEGTAGGSRKRLVWELLDRYDSETGLSAMERTTGFSLSITGLMQARGDVLRSGVATPDEAVPADLYISELEARGISIAFREE